MIKEVCYKLNKSSMLYKRLMSKHLENLNITYSQLMVLRVINMQPGINAKEILQIMDTDKATLSGILSRLERNHYIYKEKNKRDGRIQNLYISQGSENLCVEITKIEETCLKGLIKGISDRELEQFLDILDVFLINQLNQLKE